jgi:drug/metabolite transporter (DMT)-like permease
LGVALMSSAAACFAVMDSTVRLAGTLFGITLVLWVRYLVHMVVMGGWIGLSPAKRFRTAHIGFQAARGLLLLISSALAFTALRSMPVAEFTAIVMLTPIAFTLLARLFLHDAVSPLRWALVAGGFVGALLVVQPGFGGALGWVALLPLAASFSNASFQILTTRYAGSEDPHTTNFYTGLMGVLVSTPLMLAFAAEHRAAASAHSGQLHLLLAIALLGTLGHLLLIKALSQARAATLMPFQYVQIGVAAAAGWWLFGDVPNALAWCGMAVVAACGAASAWLNVREAAGRQPVSAVAADTMAD